MRWNTELADPLPAALPARERASRLQRIEGARLALLYNHKPNAARLLELIGEMARERYGIQVAKKEFTMTLNTPALPSRIAAVAEGVDLVVVGVGDSGSPSLLTVHDALEVERHGVPAVCVCTEPFGHGDAVMAAMRGAPHLGIALVPHPVGSLDDDGLRARARVALPQIVRLATDESAREKGGQR